jgi:hypothetical protein
MHEIGIRFINKFLQLRNSATHEHDCRTVTVTINVTVTVTINVTVTVTINVTVTVTVTVTISQDLAHAHLNYALPGGHTTLKLAHICTVTVTGYLF